MKKIILSILLISCMIILSSCTDSTSLQSFSEDKYAPLPTISGQGYVGCSTDQDCSNYLMSNNVLDIATECRANTCYYQSIGEFVQLQGDDGNE